MVELLLEHPRFDTISSISRVLHRDPEREAVSSIDQAMIGAASHGNVGIVRLLLEDGGVCPDAQQNAAFRKAVEHGHLDVVRLLLSDQRVNPAGEHNTLHFHCFLNSLNDSSYP